jgi:hypothetical protein
MRTTRAARALVAAVALPVAACGGGFQFGAPFEDREIKFFDDGVDLIKDPARLGGQWAVGYGDELDGRVSLADLVARVEVVSVQTDRDLDGKEAKRVTVSVVEEIYGSSPARNLFLQSLPETLGYELIQRHETELTGMFVAFVRLFEGPDGKLAKHFHLSPASPKVLERVRVKLKARKKEEGAK